MASQPEGEEEEDFPGYLAVSDDRQATVGYGGIEKPREIVGVPPELDDIVDGAIHLLRMVEERAIDDADFDTILEYMEMYMYLREPADSTLHLPDEVFETLEGLVYQVTTHYNRSLSHATTQDRSNKIFHILSQYCQKVNEFRKGCLLAYLCMKDDHQLGYLISNLHFVARQVRGFIDEKWYSFIKSLPTKRGVSSDNQSKLLQLISQRLRLVIAVTKQEMISFLRDDVEADSISLTIMICPPDKKSASTDGEEQFLDGFTDFEYTLKGLQEAFQNSAELKLAQEEKPLKLDISEGASQGAKEGLGITERKTYRGPLSPPTSSEKAEPRAEAIEKSDTTVYVPSLPPHTTTRNLFDWFKEYGVLLNVHIPRDRFLPENIRGYGLVQFLKKEDAERAIKDSKYNARMARKNNEGSALEESKIIIQDLLGLTTNVQLVEMCKGYGTIGEAHVIPQKQLGFVKFTTPDEALKALDELQSRNKFALMARPKKLLTGARRMF